MKKFTIRQRVTVTDATHYLAGRRGIVVRLRHSDNGAWVEMDTDVPDEWRVFEEGDVRARHVMLFPEECSPS